MLGFVREDDSTFGNAFLFHKYLLFWCLNDLAAYLEAQGDSNGPIEARSVF